MYYYYIMADVLQYICSFTRLVGGKLLYKIIHFLDVKISEI